MKKSGASVLGLLLGIALVGCGDTGYPDDPDAAVTRDGSAADVSSPRDTSGDLRNGDANTDVQTDGGVDTNGDTSGDADVDADSDANADSATDAPEAVI